MALKFYNYDIVFAEIPDETTLAVNITNCPNRCPGCHSPHLQADTGTVLDEEALHVLLDRYGRAITCLCFMGGDSDPAEVARLALWSKALIPGLKTAWYSGKAAEPSSLCRRFGGLSEDTSDLCHRPDGLATEAFDLCHRSDGLAEEASGRLMPFDYVKTGPWVEALGPLSSPITNQRLYRIETGTPVDITFRMRRSL